MGYNPVTNHESRFSHRPSTCHRGFDQRFDGDFIATTGRFKRSKPCHRKRAGLDIFTSHMVHVCYIYLHLGDF